VDVGKIQVRSALVVNLFLARGGKLEFAAEQAIVGRRP